jgi:hypothetical protein
MTKLRIEYLLGRGFRQALGALGLVLLTSGMANASAWDEFVRRCLVPMENFSKVDISGMAFAGKRDGPTMLSAYLPESQNFLFLVVTDDADTSLGCSLNLGENASQETLDSFAEQFVSWSTQVVSNETYDLTEGDLSSTEGALSLSSNLTREPVLSVSLWKQIESGAWVASVQETDLES